MIVTCLTGDSCAVMFEPWGSEHVLAKEDAFTVEPAPVEVSYVDGGISLWFAAEDVIVTNRSGERLIV
jgi:hypothetical protein